MSAVARGLEAEAVKGKLDWLLRFDPLTDAIYEAEHGAARVRALQITIFIGIATYNVYNLTSIALLPDVLDLSLCLRVLLVTPTSILLAWSVARVGPRWREQLVLGGMINAYLVPVFLFSYSGAANSAYTYGELPLSLVFGNMLLSLRFRHAILFTAACLLVTATAAACKAGLTPSVRCAFVIQGATACMFTLYANYRQERRRCRDYLVTLQARRASEAAEGARREFMSLSRTDALTGLPNRRHLDDVLQDWLAQASDVAVLMIDIDHFKLFNDALGHPAGDDCLRVVASAMHECVDAPTAFVARFGGEEFTCAVKGATAFEAARLARRLVGAVAALAIIHPGRSDGLGIVTISIGVAVRAADRTASPATVFAEADAALYQAKKRGRHRFVLYDRSSPDLNLMA